MKLNNNSTALNTSQFDDVQGHILQGLTNVALEKVPFRDTGYYMLATRHDQPDEIFFTFQLPHGWERDTKLYFHLHFVPLSTWEPTPNTKDVYIEYQYTLAKKDTVIPAVSTWSTLAYHTESVSYDDQFKQKKMSLFDYTPSGSKESDILLVRVKSLGGNGSYTYTDNRTGTGEAKANVAILYADVHFEKEKIGTSTEIPA